MKMDTFPSSAVLPTLTNYVGNSLNVSASAALLRVSAKKLGLANAGACNSKYVTKISFPQISNKAAEADTFKEFPT